MRESGPYAGPVNRIVAMFRTVPAAPQRPPSVADATCTMGLRLGERLPGASQGFRQSFAIDSTACFFARFGPASYQRRSVSSLLPVIEATVR